MEPRTVQTHVTTDVSREIGVNNRDVLLPNDVGIEDWIWGLSPVHNTTVFGKQTFFSRSKHYPNTCTRM